MKSIVLTSKNVQPNPAVTSGTSADVVQRHNQSFVSSRLISILADLPPLALSEPEPGPLSSFVLQGSATVSHSVSKPDK